MPHDGAEHPITGVGAWPRVGAHSHVVFDDTHDPGWSSGQLGHHPDHHQGAGMTAIPLGPRAWRRVIP